MAKIPTRPTIIGSVVGQKIVSAAFPVARPAPPRFDVYTPPQVYFAETVVPSNGEQGIRSQALTNLVHPIEVNEIRFVVEVDSTASAAFNLNCGGIIGVQITVGGVPLTNGYVPIWLFGKANRQSETLFKGLSGGVGVVQQGFYSWRFSHPMYIPPGVKVAVQFKHFGLTKDPAKVGVSIVGRRVEPRGRISRIPFATAFVSRAFDYVTDEQRDTASETALANVTGKALNVDRICGRVGVFFTWVAGAIYYLDFDGGDFSWATEARIVSSNGTPIVRDFTSMRSLFGYEGVLETPHTMDPGEFYVAEIEKKALPAGAVPTLFQGVAAISIVGWREVSL